MYKYRMMSEKSNLINMNKSFFGKLIKIKTNQTVIKTKCNKTH